MVGKIVERLAAAPWGETELPHAKKKKTYQREAIKSKGGGRGALRQRLGDSFQADPRGRGSATQGETIQ